MPSPEPLLWQRFALTRNACHPFLADGADLPDFKKEDDPLVYPAPPWRQFMPRTAFMALYADDASRRWREIHNKTEEGSAQQGSAAAAATAAAARARQKAETFYLANSDPCRNLVLAVNAALALRRPLLLTGLPGSGKTTLAYVLAEWLGLGPVLEWPVSPGAMLADALATYNPLARLQDLEISQKRLSQAAAVNRQAGDQVQPEVPPVEDYVRLGPVGTAFLPSALPRVLLIDEIDKGDLNLANELLHLFEEGKFSIPELQRAERDQARTNQDRREEGTREHGREEGKRDDGRMVGTWDLDGQGQPVKACIRGGQVQCHEFPLVVMSSNGERDFPPAFNRRCLRVPMPDFSNDPEALKAIVNSHLRRDGRPEEDGRLEIVVEQALETFAEALKRERRGDDVLATDQLLNLAFLMDGSLDREARQRLGQVVLQGLNSDLGPGGNGEP